jgi:hypothetical protein
MNSVLRNVGDAVAQKARGDTPGRFRAMVAAAAAGAVTATLTYRLLRSGDD